MQKVVVTRGAAVFGQAAMVGSAVKHFQVVPAQELISWMMRSIVARAGMRMSTVVHTRGIKLANLVALLHTRIKMKMVIPVVVEAC